MGLTPVPRVRWWWWAIGACVAARVAIPLAALVSEGTALPGLPVFRYGPFYGDANGYYAAARELIAAASRAALPLAGVVLVGAVVLGVARRRRLRPAVLVLIGGAVVALAMTVVVHEMRPAGAPVVGWPLLWAFGLAPLRVLKPGFGPDEAFAVGLALSLAAIGVTVVATAYVGLWASGKRLVGALAAALFAVWPFIPGLVVGHRAWENGTWFVDAGLHLYTEPLSTALVIGAIALLLRPAAGDLSAVAAGLALGFATVVKLSDGVIAVALVVILLVARHRRPAVLVSAGGVLSLPILLAYWDKGYVNTYNGQISAVDRTWSLHYIGPAWSDSLLFSPLLVALLVAPAILGVGVLRTNLIRALIVAPIVVTVVTYSVYYITALHPRFLYVALPLVLVLDAAAVVAVIDRLHGARPPFPPVSDS